MNDEEFLTKLREICLQFDAKYGMYNDPRLTGLTIYTFARDPDSIEQDLLCDTVKVEDKEYEREFRELSEDYDLEEREK